MWQSKDSCQKVIQLYWQGSREEINNTNYSLKLCLLKCDLQLLLARQWAKYKLDKLQSKVSFQRVLFGISYRQGDGHDTNEPAMPVWRARKGVHYSAGGDVGWVKLTPADPLSQKDLGLYSPRRRKSPPRCAHQYKTIPVKALGVRLPEGKHDSSTGPTVDEDGRNQKKSKCDMSIRTHEGWE